MKKSVAELRAVVLAEIEQLGLPKEPARLYEPIEYILSLGGKRMRPVLALMGCNMFNDSIDNALAPAMGIEVFHNFTLIHDDIMDVAPLRRGQATVHEKWNSNVAILSGDVMLIKAYDLLLQVEESKLKHVLTAFNTCATEVCEGQQMDMDFEQRSTQSPGRLC